MEKKQLLEIVDNILLPLGFARKGNRWLRKEEFIDKLVILQKSQYSNSFYLNYGYIINSLALDGHDVHVFNGLGSLNETDNNSIRELLNLENEIPDQKRIEQLTRFISEIMVHKLETIRAESDLKRDLEMRSHINDIILPVKRYFHLLK